MCRIDHNHHDPEWIKKQRFDLSRSGQGHTNCRCGKLMDSLYTGYRCLYCKEWFCTLCAEEHFGMTQQQWKDERFEAETRLDLQLKNSDMKETVKIGNNWGHPELIVIKDGKELKCHEAVDLFYKGEPVEIVGVGAQSCMGHGCGNGYSQFGLQFKNGDVLTPKGEFELTIFKKSR